MPPQEKYANYTLFGKKIEELLSDLKNFQDEAEQIKAKLEEAGATVEVK